jgi:hypothetical protein
MKNFKTRIPFLKVGDRYIHYTKHGGINIDVVTHVGYTSMITRVDGENLTFKCWYIRNKNGVTLNLDGSDGLFYKLD